MSKNQTTFWNGSTILTVRKNGQVVLAGDGQLTEGNLILKSNVRKVRRLGDGSVIGGFTGSTADSLILFEKLESIITQTPNQLLYACVELTKFWRKEPVLSGLKNTMIVVNKNQSLVLTSAGDVLEKEDGIIGIGFGGPYAVAAARALFDIDGLSARAIVEKSMNVAADVCVFTNNNIVFESIEF